MAVIAMVVAAWGLETNGPPAERWVRFAISPSGARLAVDGQRVAWFGAQLPLSLGTHDVVADVPSSRCCWALRTTVRVNGPPTGDPRAVQRIVLRLRLRPAQVVLVGAPCGGTIACPNIGLVSAAGELALTRLPHAQWAGRCVFAGNGAKPVRTAIVTLRAGEMNAVPWPHSQPRAPFQSARN